MGRVLTDSGFSKPLSTPRDRVAEAVMNVNPVVTPRENAGFTTSRRKM